MDNTEIKSNIDALELYSENYPFRLSLRIKNFESETEFKKFAHNVERIVRSCVEYKLWRNYILDILGVNQCMVTKENLAEVTLEIHHHIPTLFVLVKSIINKKIEKEEEFSTFDIALEAIELHFSNKIGYLVLVSPLHERVHNRTIQIPVKLVKGNYKKFIEEYSKYIDEDDLERINEKISYQGEVNCEWTKDNYPGLEEMINS